MNTHQITLILVASFVWSAASVVGLLWAVRRARNQAHFDGYVAGWRDRATEDPSSPDYAPVFPPLPEEMELAVNNMLQRMEPDEIAVARTALASIILKRAPEEAPAPPQEEPVTKVG